MNKKALIFLILAVMSFFASLFLNFHKIKVPYLGGFYKEVRTDIIFKNEPPRVFYENIEVKNYIKIDDKQFLFVPYQFDLVKNISFENAQNIEKISVYNGNEGIFLNEVKDKIEVNNDKTMLDKICVGFLSYFYNPQFYVISYIFLFLFLCNLRFSCKKTKIAFISLFLLSIILRLGQIDNIPFWDDEIYILTHTNKWFEVFQDPGNPPLYFILFKIYRNIVQTPELYRFSSVIIGCLFNVCFYLYIKAFMGKKTALIALFTVSINVILIYFSQEIRCYILLMLLTVINSYFLLRYNSKRKYAYLISAIALLYTHFYGAFFVFYNFIFGCSLFFKNKFKIKSFILINLISFFAFLPVLIVKRESISSDFNSWLSVPNFGEYLSVIDTLFGNILLMFILICIVVFVYIKSNKKCKFLIKYSTFAILTVLLCAIFVTYLIKPVFYYRYFYVVFPSILTLVVCVFNFFLKKRWGLIFIFLMIISFDFEINYQNLFCNHNLYVEFIRHDIDKTKTNYVFLSDTVIGYKKFEVEGAKLYYLPVNKGINTLDIRKYDIKTPSVLYLMNFYLDDYTLKTAKDVKIYKTPLGLFCRVEL